MTFISVVGAVLVLLAFVLSNLGKMQQTSLVYSMFNFVGTGLLAVTLIDPLNIGAFAVEVVWCGFSAFLVWRCIRTSAISNRSGRL